MSIWMRNTLTISMKNSLIADSGFWIALFHEEDPYHELSTRALDRFARYLFVVTWPVIAEVGHMLHRHAGFQQQLAFLSGIQQGGARIFHLNDEGHLFRMTKLMGKLS